MPVSSDSYVHIRLRFLSNQEQPVDHLRGNNLIKFLKEVHTTTCVVYIYSSIIFILFSIECNSMTLGGQMLQHSIVFVHSSRKLKLL